MSINTYEWSMKIMIGRISRNTDKFFLNMCIFQICFHKIYFYCCFFFSKNNFIENVYMILPYLIELTRIFGIVCPYDPKTRCHRQNIPFLFFTMFFFFKVYLLIGSYPFWWRGKVFNATFNNISVI